MKIRLPKDLRGFNYDGICPVELNNFDVDLLLPSLFFRVVTGGKGRGRYPNDPETIREYVVELAHQEAVRGFDGDTKLRLLERLVRTSVIQVGLSGRSRRKEKIEGLQGYTLLTFKPGFPDQHSRIRRVDVLIYRMLTEELGGEQAVRTFFREIFGRGIRLETGMEPGGAYDGQTNVDTITRLSLALLDVFKTTGIRNAPAREFREALPAVARAMARDLSRYMKTYHDRMPIEAFTYHLRALINLELFIYTMKLVYAVIQLVSDPRRLPEGMQTRDGLSLPDLYFDFMAAGSGLSREMARHCVRRDLETLQAFIPANLQLRQLDRYLERGTTKAATDAIERLVVRNGTGAEYLQSLLLACDDPYVAAHVLARAANDEDRIREENRPPTQGEDDDPIVNEDIDRIAATGDTALDRLVLLLTEAQVSTVSTNLGKWFRDVGGLTKPYGVLAGASNNRQSWRYAPGSDVLATLVQLAAVDYPGWKFDHPSPRPIGLQKFLRWLEQRFGVLVDRPPDEINGAEYVTASQDNLDAMLSRLKLMGIFRDLSDDFTVQHLTPPYMTTVEERDTA